MDKNVKILILSILIISICSVILFTIMKKEKFSKNIELSEEYIVKTWEEHESVNRPILLEGMSPIVFEEGKEEPVILDESQMKEGIWYDYKIQEQDTSQGGTSKWANAISKDGSMWVWIPRYAYKITRIEGKAQGTIDIMFLNGNTNYNSQNIDVTELEYTVHPAFKDGTKNNYNNGEWDQEIQGIWVAKFEAGFAGQENTGSKNVQIKNTNLKFKRSFKNILGNNVMDETYMTYPVFMGKTFSYNNLEIGEMYKLSASLTEKENPYGFNEEVDSHMMKNSEWGAITYLAHSKYGRNGTKVNINNINTSKAIYSAGPVTGYAGKEFNEKKYNIEVIDKEFQDSYDDKSFAWYLKKGSLSSTTGNLYGIYDMNGGCSEYMAGYLENIDNEVAGFYAEEMIKRNPKSTKYCTVYKSSKDEQSAADIYNDNIDKYGEAIIETSKKGVGYRSWFNENSLYTTSEAAFFLRGGEFDGVSYSGLFSYTNHSGHSFSSYGFRAVLIKK